MGLLKKWAVFGVAVMFSGLKDFYTYFFVYRLRKTKNSFLTFGLSWWVLSIVEKDWLDFFRALLICVPLYHVAFYFLFPFFFLVFLFRGGTMTTFPGIQIIFVELIMFLFPLRVCGSQISLLKKCKCKCICTDLYTLTHWLMCSSLIF